MIHYVVRELNEPDNEYPYTYNICTLTVLGEPINYDIAFSKIKFPNVKEL